MPIPAAQIVAAALAFAPFLGRPKSELLQDVSTEQAGAHCHVSMRAGMLSFALIVGGQCAQRRRVPQFIHEGLEAARRQHDVVVDKDGPRSRALALDFIPSASDGGPTIHIGPPRPANPKMQLRLNSVLTSNRLHHPCRRTSVWAREYEHIDALELRRGCTQRPGPVP